MRGLKLCMAVGLILAVSGIAGAATFVFDPDDLIQMYPASAGSDVEGGRKADQLNARRVHETWAGTFYETFYNPAAPHTQPNDYNTYMNWRDGLGDGEGISGFNIWLQDNPRARSWGEEVVWKPGDAVAGTADAGGKWSVEVIPNPWGETGTWLVQWSTDNPDYYINTLSDIGEFSFSGTAHWDDNANGYDATDPEVQLGEDVRLWFGVVNWTESDGGGGWIQDWSLHFDATGWGERSPNNGGPWSAGFVDSEGYGSGYEGVLELTAVPEPFSVATLFMAVGGLGMYYRKKRRMG